MALVKVAAHPRFEMLRRRLQETPEIFQPWSGFCYRVTTLEYPGSGAIVSGEGSFRNGGRWNAIGSFRAVYGSTEDTVAVAESRSTADYLHVPMPFRTPRLLVAIELSLGAVLDLTSADTQRVLEVAANELRAEDWRKVQETRVESLTQAIGRAVFGSGGEGLLVPSAQIMGGINVVYLPGNCRPTSRVRVLESEKLDRVRLA